MSAKSKVRCQVTSWKKSNSSTEVVDSCVLCTHYVSYNNAKVVKKAIQWSLHFKSTPSDLFDPVTPSTILLYVRAIGLFFKMWLDISPVLALHDPFGVDVPLIQYNFDTINQSIVYIELGEHSFRVNLCLSFILTDLFIFILPMKKSELLDTACDRALRFPRVHGEHQGVHIHNF